MRPGFLSQATEKFRTLELTRDGMVTLKERRSITPTRPMKAPLNGDGSECFAAALREYAAAGLTQVHKALEGRYDFGELRNVRTAMQAGCEFE